MADRELIAKYGQPQKVDSAEALATAGLTADIEPGDVIAFVYPSEEAARAFQTVNREEHNIPPLALLQTDDGWLGVNDLRRKVADLKAKNATSHSDASSNG